MLLSQSEGILNNTTNLTDPLKNIENSIETECGAFTLALGTHQHHHRAIGCPPHYLKKKAESAPPIGRLSESWTSRLTAAPGGGVAAASDFYRPLLWDSS